MLFRDMIKKLTSPQTTKRMKLCVLLTDGSKFDIGKHFNIVFTYDQGNYMGRTIYVQVFGEIDSNLIQEKNIVEFSEIDLLNYTFMEKSITGTITQAKSIMLSSVINWELILWFPTQQPEVKPAT